MDIETVAATDVPRIAATLANAFDDDPIMEHLLPEGKRMRRLRAFFTGELRVQHLVHGLCFTDPDRSAAALWDPPGQWRMSMLQVARASPWLFPAFGRNVPKALRALSVIEKQHPAEPHYYLAILGTEPSRQGKGLGSAVMQPVLERCDTEGRPAYLESSKASNIPFYQRHGFTVTGEIALPGGPSMWPMWREPQPR